MRWLHFRLEAPMASFGDAVIDSHRTTADFPTQSMLTGLLANALGWTRTMKQQHRDLQDRLVFGALREHEPPLGRMTDYQTARLDKSDRSWTTRGYPVGRDGGAATYHGAHQRWLGYHSDLRVSGVMRLDPADQTPNLDELAVALDYPARPLFVGRKACLPSSRMFAGWVDDAPDARTALLGVTRSPSPVRALWPASEGVEGASRVTMVTDERDWITGTHGGSRRVCEGELPATVVASS